MPKLTIELTDKELAGLQKECRRQEREDGIEYIPVEEQAASAVRFLLMTLEINEKEVRA